MYFFSHIFAGGYGANPYQAIQGCYQQYQNNPQYQQQVYGWGGCHIGSCSGVASALSIKQNELFLKEHKFYILMLWFV